MELKEKILQADFAAKKNLLHNLKARKYFFGSLIGCTAIYGIFTILPANSRYNYVNRVGGHNSQKLFYDILSNRPISFGFHYKPEIHMRIANKFQQDYVDFIIENKAEESKYKPYVWK